VVKSLRVPVFLSCHRDKGELFPPLLSDPWTSITLVGHNVPDNDIIRTFMKNFQIHWSMCQIFFCPEFLISRGLAATSAAADRKIESTNPARA
jgi:hypothetical protein